MAASLTMVAVIAWSAVALLHGPSAEERLTQEVVSSHVRSLMANHLLDVASDDRHVVKPWFTGKLDFAPFVPDLAEHGFPLVGGRLDYLDKRAVVALVYQRRQHIINLFIWPTAQRAPVEAKSGTSQGYHLFHWTQSGMVYWAVSDLNSRELQELVRLIQSQTAR